ncbi:MAG: S8 family serine peptidase [Flavobacteriales bacterium]|nr:S8 family serine peptidase [Flavobacteriales bacterium]
MNQAGSFCGKLLIAVLWCFTLTPSKGQVAPLHHWVGFTDKADCGVDLYAPEAGLELLSPRALERRQRQGIPLDSLDLPVSPPRISAVLALGAGENGQALRLLHRSRWLNGIVIQVDTAVVDSAGMAALLADIAALDGVAQVRRARWYGGSQPAPQLPQARSGAEDLFESGPGPYGACWSQVRQLKVDLIHGLGHRGGGMMVGVLDSGFDRVDENPAFDRARGEGRILVGGNFPNGGAISPWIYDEHAHGAMVLSTMAGFLDTPGGQHYMGTAPDATYMLFRTEDVGWEHLVEEYHWVAAAERADSIGCDVLNTSLGYSLFDAGSQSHLVGDLDGDTFPISQASDIAASRGMLVFSSAGNSGNSPWQKITAPADGDSVIAVGAVTSFGQHASFSSYGPTADGRIKPDLCATGQDASYVHPDGSIRTGNGTSFSSPILCGAAVSLWSAHPDRPAWAIRQALMESAHQFSTPDTVIGYGVPDLWQAHLALGGKTLTETDDLLMYPNPVTASDDGLHIVFEENNLLAASGSALTYMVSDARGRLMAVGQIERDKQPLTTFTLFVDMLEAGTYTLSLYGVPEEDEHRIPTVWARFIVESR